MARLKRAGASYEPAKYSIRLAHIFVEQKDRKRLPEASQDPATCPWYVSS